MKTTHDFLRDRLLTRAGIPVKDFGRAPAISELMFTEISPEFYERMRKAHEDYLTMMTNRVVMGYFRYGPKTKNPRIGDNTKAMMNCLRRYLRTGNKENLVDMSNYAQLEFRFADRPGAYFEAMDDEQHFG